MKATTLGEIAEWGSGGTPKRSVSHYFGNGTPWVSIADLNDGVVNYAKESLTPAGVANSAAKVVPAGTLLIAMYGSIGKLGITSREMCTSQAIAFAKPGLDVVDRRYLFNYLLAQRPVLLAKGRGGTQQNISQGDLRKWPILLPTLAEQRRIAAILDQADALRAKRRQALAHLDDLTQSTFHHMFGHLEPDTTVVEVSMKVRTGPFGSQLLHSEFVDEGISVLGLDNVVGNEFTWGQRRYITCEKYQQLKRYTVTPGDVLISIMGTTGRCVVIPAEIPTAINTKHICAITPDKERIDSTFLWAAFLWHYGARAHLRRQTKGSIMEGLNMGIIKALPIPVPALSAQLAFAEKVKRIVAQRRLTERVADSENALFASLQSRAFRGRI